MLPTNLHDTVKVAWREALGPSTSIDMNTDFFESGGNSMEAARMTAMVSQSLGRRVRMRQLLDAPTLGAYIQALLDAESDGE